MTAPSADGAAENTAVVTWATASSNVKMGGGCIAGGSGVEGAALLLLEVTTSSLGMPAVRRSSRFSLATPIGA
jgi:hypothetical protein